MCIQLVKSTMASGAPFRSILTRIQVHNIFASRSGVTRSTPSSELEFDFDVWIYRASWAESSYQNLGLIKVFMVCASVLLNDN